MRRTSLLAAVVATILTAAGALGAAPPNIVIILADDLGYSDVGCYGSEIRTPNIDALAAGGLRFTQFYNNGRCCPTRASLLTGLHAHQTGVGHMVEDLGLPAYRGNLGHNAVTIAEALRPAGYRTGMSGKWHVTPLTAGKDNWPRRRGFDRFFGIIGSVRSYFDPPTLTRDDESIQAGKDFYLTDAVTNEAVAQLDEFAKQKEPFFLYVAYTAPHWPQHALPEDIAKYRDTYRIGWDQLRADRHRRQIELGVVDKRWPLAPRDSGSLAWPDAPNHDWQAARMAVFAAMIDRMDQGIGRLVRRLRETGREDNTLIFFLADNGGCAEEMTADWRSRFPAKTRDGISTRVGNDPAVTPGPAEVFQSYGLPWANASNTPFRRFKHYAHDGGIATPLIVRWPAAAIKPAITHQPGHVIDLLPTCLEAARVTYPTKVGDRAITPLEGKSLLPIVQGKERAGHAALYWEHEGNRAVRQGNWKLVAAHGGPWELYDLAADRTETTDLAAKQPDMARQLAAQYEQWAKRVGVASWDEIEKKAAAAKAPPQVIAHRGLARHAPENTLANFRACLELRLGIELDVRRTKDGHLVCLHDPNLDRTTNGKGKGKVGDITLAELKKLSAGAHFDPAFADERIATLDEIFALLARYPTGRTIAIDLKEPDTEADLVKLAKQHGVLDRLLFIGLAINDPAVRQKLRKADSRAHVACLAQTPADFAAALAATDADWVYLRYVATPEELAKVHAAGKRAFIAGPKVAGREMAAWKDAATAGIDAILTDYPLELAEMLRGAP